MSVRIRNIKRRYRSGTNDIGADFFVPCLNECNEYRRAAGYFTSSSLRNWAGAFPRLVDDPTMSIKLLISPTLTPDDIDALMLATSYDSKVELLRIKAEELLSLAVQMSCPYDGSSAQAQLLSWLIASERLEIRFAYPKHVDHPGIFHEKTGIFTFPNGDKLAFTGSANETAGGHHRNYESLYCFRSWDEHDQHRIDDCEEEFNSAWNNTAVGLIVVKASGKSLSAIKRRCENSSKPVSDKSVANKWRHQKEAMETFVKAERGILNMATGTGKTRTSLLILKNLLENNRVSTAIITTHGNDLLNQWYITVCSWLQESGLNMTIQRHYGKTKEIPSFLLSPSQKILICSRQNLPKVINHLSDEYKRELLIIHDEVHGLGEASSQTALRNKLKGIKYSLGLSATPIREYDPNGTDFIFDEVGQEIFSFNLKDAIERGILCEFDYVPLPYQLTSSDKERIQKAYSLFESKKKNGESPSKESLYRDIAKVYKTAEQKPTVFSEYIHEHPDLLRNSIIFVETKSFGEQLLPTIHKLTHKFSTYYDTDGPQILDSFAKGNVDCLITCHKLSQGIDIQHLQNVFLISSNRSMLETIQRIGRCLRTSPENPTKRARVIDFVRENTSANRKPNSDELRAQWLDNLSKVKQLER